MQVKKKWHENADDLYKQGKTWVEIAEEIQKIPGVEGNIWSIAERVRSYIRKQSFYTGQQTQAKAPVTQAVPQETPQTGESVTYKADGSIVSTKFIFLAEGENLTPSQLLKLHGLNPTDWKVYTYTNNFWNSQAKGGALLICYQSKLIATPLKGVRPDPAELRSLYVDLVRDPLPVRVDHKVYGDKLAVVHVADLHLGKLCWQGESPENYDYKIARDVYFRAVFDIADRLEGKGIEQILFVWSNDFFNSDNPEQTTTKGTPQDTDVREKKLHRVGCQMLAQGIEILKQIAPVRTFYTPSNHDEMSAYHALLLLEAYFRNDPEVQVDPEPYPRKFVLYGITLLGFCHGNTENSKGSKDKASRLASTMPIEARELWSQAKVYEMHVAHLHGEQVTQEINGVIVRRVSSPTAADNYHTTAGFIGAVRKCQAFIYEKERGLVDVLNSPV